MSETLVLIDKYLILTRKLKVRTIQGEYFICKGLTLTKLASCLSSPNSTSKDACIVSPPSSRWTLPNSQTAACSRSGETLLTVVSNRVAKQLLILQYSVFSISLQRGGNSMQVGSKLDVSIILHINSTGLKHTSHKVCELTLNQSPKLNKR